MQTIYNVIYTAIDGDDFQNPVIETKTFDTEERAENYISREFNAKRKELEEGEARGDVIHAENYGNNAEILDGEFGYEIVYVRHEWRVFKDTVNFEGE